MNFEDFLFLVIVAVLAVLASNHFYDAAVCSSENDGSNCKMVYVPVGDKQ